MTAFISRDFAAKLKEQATPRALMGIGLLGAILIFLLISNLVTSVASKTEQLEDMRRDLAIQLALSENSEWIARAEATRETLATTEQGFWVGATNGIVAAQLQGVIEESARSSGLIRARVSVQPEPVQLTPRAVLFEIRVVAQDRDGQFLSFMQSLSRSTSILVPSSFEWLRANGRSTVTIFAPAMVRAPVNDGEAEP